MQQNQKLGTQPDLPNPGGAFGSILRRKFFLWSQEPFLGFVTGTDSKKNAPANRGVGTSKRERGLRSLRIDLGVVALGVPLVDDVVDHLDVALGVEGELAQHGVPFAGLDGLHDLLRVGGLGLAAACAHTCIAA